MRHVQVDGLRYIVGVFDAGYDNLLCPLNLAPLIHSGHLYGVVNAFN